jgi:hypothetical protein
VTNKLTKQNAPLHAIGESLERINNDLKKSDLTWLTIGAIVISNNENVYRVEGIVEEEEEYWANQNDKKRTKHLVIKIKLSPWKGGNSWNTENLRTYTLDEAGKQLVLIDTNDIEKYMADLVYSSLTAITDDEVKDEDDDTEEEDDDTEEEIPLSNSTEIGFTMNKDAIVKMKENLERQTMALEAQARALKCVLDAKKHELYRIAEGFKKQLKNVNRVIGSIELYLGVGEEIVHLIKGEHAPKDDPICIRQMLLYMDEEVADFSDGGIDFHSIDKFSEWLTKDRNFEKLLPETKGVIGIRIRRYEKRYEGADAMTRAFWNEANKNCYFIIRNGENIYTLWTAISEEFPPRLFLMKDELQGMLEAYKKNPWERDKEKLEDIMYGYKRIFLVLKGIIERTEIFKPYPDQLQEFDIFRPETYGNFINYIYDDEAALPDGRLRYKEWKKELNNGIKRGSRIYVGRGAPDAGGSYSSNSNYHRDADPDRLLFYTNKVYDSPPPGVYTLFEGKREEDLRIYKYYKGGFINGGPKVYLDNVDEERWEEEHSGWNSIEDKEKIYKGVTREQTGEKKKIIGTYFYIRYNPGGDVYEGWFGNEGSHERKKNISYIIDPNDDFIFNYDALPFEDIDFYLESRIDRPNYLHMIPTLQDLKKFRLKEMEAEKGFAKLTANELSKECSSTIVNEESMLTIVLNNVEWWKRKVIHKRPITSEEDKAWRMIKARCVKQLKDWGYKRKKAV